jgi:hypothetical protein
MQQTSFQNASLLFLSGVIAFATCKAETKAKPQNAVQLHRSEPTTVFILPRTKQTRERREHLSVCGYVDSHQSNSTFFHNAWLQSKS